MTDWSLTEAALEDLEEIFEYLSAFSLEVGERFIEDFERKCDNLVKFPKMGRSYTEFSPDLRGIPIESYMIFYRILSQRIEIIRVLSGYRNLESVFSDEAE